jgi:hypothetical protein
MFSLQIKSYSPANPVKADSFFVLCKGLNSGKPLKTPCPNCFVITAANDQEKDFLFWLCWGLWQSKKFHYFLSGSVIPFIRIHEFKTFFAEKATQAFTEKEAHLKSIATLKQLEALEKQYKQNLLLIQDAKRAIFHRYVAKV